MKKCSGRTNHSGNVHDDKASLFSKSELTEQALTGVLRRPTQKKNLTMRYVDLQTQKQRWPTVTVTTTMMVIMMMMEHGWRQSRRDYSEAYPGRAPKFFIAVNKSVCVMPSSSAAKITS